MASPSRSIGGSGPTFALAWVAAWPPEPANKGCGADRTPRGDEGTPRPRDWPHIWNTNEKSDSLLRVGNPPESQVASAPRSGFLRHNRVELKSLMRGPAPPLVVS
jgi:hypothetical protein